MTENLKTRDSVKKLLWLIPIILSIHNIEEALTMPQWMSAQFPLLLEKIPLFNHLQFSRVQLYISLFFVTFFPFLLTFYCLRGDLSQRKIAAILTLQSIIFWNALVPHIGGLFVLGMYNPGAVTAVVFNIPFTIVLFRRLQMKGIVSVERKRNIFLVGLLLYLPVVYLNHLIAGFVAKILF